MKIMDAIKNYVKNQNYRFLGQYRYYRGSEKIRFVEDKLTPDKRIRCLWIEGDRVGRVEKIPIINCWRKPKWDK